MIKSLRVENYRLFKDFKIPSLARVNLMVGSNNSGKSGLLEAIYLLKMTNAAEYALVRILEDRGEIEVVGDAVNPENDMSRRGHIGFQVAPLFWGRTLDMRSQIKISADDSALWAKIFIDTKDNGDSEAKKLTIENNKSYRVDLDMYDNILLPEYRRLLALGYSARRHGKTTQFLSTDHVDYSDLAPLWDDIVLTPAEDRVVSALQVVENNVERIGFTQQRTPHSGVVVKLKGDTRPIPLGSMGDGMRRMLAMAITMVSARGGTFLVDEIDTGLHYSVLTDMWRLVLETAVEEDIQVFATTHSWDCVRAFQQVLCQQEDESLGQLVRLDRVEEQTKPVIFSADELAIAVEQGIEIR